MCAKALAAASVLLLIVGGNVANSQTEQALIDELIQKAEKNETEGSLCSRVKWPNGDNLEGFTAFLRNASVGTWTVNTYRNGNCELDRVTDVKQSANGKCVTYKIWACSRDGICGVIPSTVDCLNNNGVFVTRNGKGG
jgi:hypothetical protein